MEDIWFHITPLENLSSILDRGLIMYQTQTSDQPKPLGHYVSSNWIELLASKTYEEIFRYDVAVVLSIDTFGLRLELDPEYDKDDDSDGFNVRVIKDIVVNPRRISVECTLSLYKSGIRAMRPMDIVGFAIREYEKYKCSRIYRESSSFTEALLCES